MVFVRKHDGEARHYTAAQPDPNEFPPLSSFRAARFQASRSGEEVEVGNPAMALSLPAFFIMRV